MKLKSSDQFDASEPVRVVGVRSSLIQDLYYSALRASWSQVIIVLLALLVLANSVFAFLYVVVGGVINMRPGSWVDALFFSIQTMTTIGYGVMYPSTTFANAVVAVEAFIGMAIQSVVTGLIFAKFSQPKQHVIFAKYVVVDGTSGIDRLCVRVGNNFGNCIVSARIRLNMIWVSYDTKRYNSTELLLERDSSPKMSYSWSVSHVIDDSSPLVGYETVKMQRDRIGITVTLTGIDEVTMQSIQVHHHYTSKHILWDARHVDLLSLGQDLQLQLDMQNFHEVAVNEVSVRRSPRNKRRVNVSSERKVSQRS